MSCRALLVQASVGDLATISARLEPLSAEQRVEWALAHLPGHHVLSSSFGMQAAVMLQLVTRVAPGTPVIFIDTGYHFAETYRFVDELTDRLQLNLKVFRAAASPAWQEARHGQRWTHGREGIEQYNQDNKVEPMQRGLDELKAGTWLSGLRRNQATSRASLQLVDCQWNRYKVHPIADWTDRDVHIFLARHGLPYHPLRDKGYVSIGDWHTTRALKDIDSADQARFFGLVRECGLHQI
ncbi:MAG: phosphoadenylyl-sulfate reductase [Wenzhouxiangella sp.]